MSLTEKQLAMRRTGMTAGDLRALLGEDPYGRTQYDVWCSKVGLDAPVPETEAMSIGNELESMVLRRGAEKRGLYVIPRDPETLTVRHPKHPHHLATPDAFLGESRLHDPCALAEGKVVGLEGMWHLQWGEEDDAIPDWCLVQVTWQMHVAAIPRCIVCALRGTEVRTYEIVLHPELEAAAVETCDRFWTDHVLTRRPPAADGSEAARRMLRAQFPRERAGYQLLASPEVEEQARTYFECKRKIDEAEAMQALAAQRICELVGDAERVTGDGWRLLYKWREATTYRVEKEGYRHFDIRAVKVGRKR